MGNLHHFVVHIDFSSFDWLETYLFIIVILWGNTELPQPPGLMWSFLANKILLTVFTANWFPPQWKSTCKKNCKTFISVFKRNGFWGQFPYFFKAVAYIYIYKFFVGGSSFSRPLTNSWAVPSWYLIYNIKCEDDAPKWFISEYHIILLLCIVNTRSNI